MKSKTLLTSVMLCLGINGFADGLTYDFESNYSDWGARGTGTTTIELSSEQKHGGNQSLYVSNRSSNWHGAYLTNDYLQAGKTYIFSGYVFATENATINLSLQYDVDGSASYPSVANASVYAYNWTEISGEIVIPEEVENIQAYLQSSTATLSFYIDDFTCTEKVTESVDFSSQISLKELFADYFKIGTAATASEITPQNTKDMILHHFNSLTPGNELKPDALLDQTASISDGDNVNPQVKLPTATKTVLKFCEENSMPMRGHVFVWHSQTPDWFFNEGFQSDGATVSKEVMDQRMENYIKNVIEMVTTNYPNLNIYAWDIVNETFKNAEGVMRDAGSNYTTDGASRWMEIYGDNTFIYNAFTFAKKYIPAGCKMYYNDYNEYIPSKRDGIYALVKDLYEKGLCDGIGMQSHLSTSYPSVDLYKQALVKYASVGCNIQITELDITLADGATYDTQAQMYKDLFDIYKEYKDNISLVAFWGTNDENSWRASGEPLPFANYQPKAAYYRIIEDMELSTKCSTTSADFPINVYPSLTNDAITITAASDFVYQLFDMAGNKVLNGKAEGDANVHISVNGAYVLSVTTGNSIKTFKIVKER